MARTPNTFRTLFVSDLHGQHKVWKNTITKAANDSDKIIQMGNLIGCNDFVKDYDTRGANQAILTYARIWNATDDQSIQLAGPNEIIALNAPNEWTNSESDKALRDAWFPEEPPMVTAHADNGRLVTHGGLTYGEWVEIGRPDTAEEAAHRLNEKYARTLYQGESLTLGHMPNFAANPIFADPIIETYGSWLTTPEECPFPQIHAEKSLIRKEARALLTETGVPTLHAYIQNPSYRSFGSICNIRNQVFIGVDLDLEGKVINRLTRPKNLYVERTAL